MEVRPTVFQPNPSPERCCTRRGFRVFLERGFAALPLAPNGGTTYGPA